MRPKLLLLLFFVYSFTWSQTARTLTTPSTGTFKVPAGVTSMDVECWGAGGAGGGVVGLVSLYGGGGGGGGAYNKTTFTSIVPAATLSFTVGAGGAGISGANGANGGNSIFSTVTVNGGLGGGKGNPSHGVGGAGGAASGTGTIFSGGQGGNAVLISGTLNSGAGGGGAGAVSNGGNASNGTAGTSGNANGSTGAGAPPVLILSDGIAGGSPGGGGSGGQAILGLFGNARGGNGGNGQIKVTYTCPTYGLSSTAADDVCTGSGTTTTVRLTSTVSSLPNGDYVVTYDRSNPSLNGTGLTANMTVSGGIGTFIATGFTATGTSTITITNISSGIVTQITPGPTAQIPPALCGNNITSNNTVNIAISPVSVGGAVSGGSSICSGNTSAQLTLSGKVGAVIKWQYAVSPFSTWTDIATTTTTYTSIGLTQTTQFRAVVKNGGCTEISSTATTVTVNPLPTIATIGTLTDICFSSSSQTAVLPYSATTNSPVNYSIVWSGAANSAGLTNQGVTPFAFSSGAGSLSTIAIPAGVTAGSYTGTLTVLNANSCFSTHAIQITIKPMPTAPSPGTITQPTCVLTTGSVTLSGLPASVTWTIRQSGTTSTTYSNTGTSYTVSGLAAGSYQFTVEYTGSCTSDLSSSVIVNPLITNTYNSGGWSGGTPTINQNLVFASPYVSAGNGNGNLSGCSCLINSGITVLIKNDDTLTINNEVVNNGGTLTFENNASLVQVANVANTGNVVYKRISKPMKNFDFTYWASPVTGQTLFNLSPNTLADKYFSFTGTAWKQENASATVMQRGVGYIIRTPKEGVWTAPYPETVIFPYSQPVQFVGVPNNGSFSGENVQAGKFYLVGNPYPSALDADKFLFANPNPSNSAVLDGTIYFWTHNSTVQHGSSGYSYSSDDYASYNGVGGIATLPAASGGAAPNGKIASGQSFFALANADGTIIFNNGMRVAGNNNQFFKPAKTSKSSLLERHRVWLNMTNTGGAFKQILIGYVEGATNDFDSSFDGLSFDGNAFIDFYSINLGNNLVIQGRNLPFSDSDVIPLGYRSVIAGAFTISIDHADGVLNNQAVFIEDKLTNTVHDLTQSGYTFNTATGVYNNRFSLTYTNKTLSSDDFEQYNNDVAAWVENKSIRLRSEKENIDKVFIYDISGKLIYSDVSISASETIISNLKFKNEVLLIKIVLADDRIITKKIVTTLK